MFSNIKNIVKKIGFTAAALALAFGIASAPVASASSLLSDGTSPIVEQVSTGKLAVSVWTMSASAINPVATVTVSNEQGAIVAQTLAGVNSEVVGFELTEGLYKITVTAKGYQTTGGYVKVAANELTEVKYLLVPRSSTPGGIATR